MLSKDLIHAYEQTLFRVDLPTGNFVLRIGIPSVELLHCYREYTVSQSAYITA